MGIGFRRPCLNSPWSCRLSEPPTTTLTKCLNEKSAGLSLAFRNSNKSTRSFRRFTLHTSAWESPCSLVYSQNSAEILNLELPPRCSHSYLARLHFGSTRSTARLIKSFEIQSCPMRSDWCDPGLSIFRIRPSEQTSFRKLFSSLGRLEPPDRSMKFGDLLKAFRTAPFSLRLAPTSGLTTHINPF